MDKTPPPEEHYYISKLTGCILLSAGVIFYMYTWNQSKPELAFPAPLWVTEMMNFFKFPLIVLAIGVIWGGNIERKSLSK